MKYAKISFLIEICMSELITDVFILCMELCIRIYLTKFILLGGYIKTNKAEMYVYIYRGR